MNIESSKIVRRSDRVDETRIGDRLVLYQRDTGTGIVLNPMGSLVWDSLETPRSIEDVAEILANQHRTTPRQQIDKDVAAYVQSLKGHLLIDETA